MKYLAFALFFLLASISNLRAQTPFYQGKTIRIVVGNIAGDAYDLWARIFAQHMGKYIPGNPTFIVQNMPGAGGHHRRQLRLLRRQTGWSNDGSIWSFDVFRPAFRTQGSSI